jgi:hypothetical protein
MAAAVMPRQVSPSNQSTKAAGKGALHGEMLIHLVTSLLIMSSLTVTLRYALLNFLSTFEHHPLVS